MSRKILVIDDDPVHRGHIERILTQLGYQAHCVVGGEEGLRTLLGPARSEIEAVILDLVMPDLDGMAVLTRLRRANIRVPVIVLVKSTALDLAMNAIAAGAQDFAVIPVGKERLTVALTSAFKFSALQSLSLEQSIEAGLLPASDDLDLIDPELKRLLDRAGAIKASELPLLIEGGVGSGRTLLARAIHKSSSKVDKNIVTLSAAALNQDDTSSTLRSAFSSARNGTIIIQDCHHLNIQSQNTLIEILKAPQRRNAPRCILTSDGTLIDLVKAGTFLEDLFYRITLSTLRIRPLPQRQADLLLLIQNEICRFGALYGYETIQISESAKNVLLQAPWVAERRSRQFVLKSIIERAKSHVISAQDIIDSETIRPAARERVANGLSLINEAGLMRPMAELEREIIEFALQRSGGRVANVAQELGIARSTLYRKLESNGLNFSEIYSIAIGDAA